MVAPIAGVARVQGKRRQDWARPETRDLERFWKHAYDSVAPAVQHEAEVDEVWVCGQPLFPEGVAYQTYGISSRLFFLTGELSSVEQTRSQKG